MYVMCVFIYMQNYIYIYERAKYVIKFTCMKLENKDELFAKMPIEY